MRRSEQLTIFFRTLEHLLESWRTRSRLGAFFFEPRRTSQNLIEAQRTLQNFTGTLWNVQEPVEPYTTILNFFFFEALFSPLKHCRTFIEPCGTLKNPKESGRTLSTLSERQKTQSNLTEHLRTLKNLLLENPRTSADLREL